MRDPLCPLQWEQGVLWILDQRKLPGRIQWIRAVTPERVARAIETLAVRGAPAIGIAAAYGVVLAAAGNGSRNAVLKAVHRLAATRPTGYNLHYALQRMQTTATQSGKNLLSRLEREALRIHREDERSCDNIARYGSELLGRKEGVLTYCNTGALATGGVGTALGVIKRGWRRGKIREVFACETRPLLQGARLTVWECTQTGIPVTLICDNTAAYLMRLGKVDRVLVGADRIARNGDTSNKVGTLSLALAAKSCGIPFHVAAPLTTFDLSLRSGGEIPIEERSAGEVTSMVAGLGKLQKLNVFNPSFDITPAKLVTSFITDQGVIRPPFARQTVLRQKQ